MWCEKFCEVSGGVTVQAVMGVEEEFVFNTEVNGEPVKIAEDGRDVIVFPHPHQDPGSAVLYILELFDAPARNPNEECVTVV